MKARLLFIVVGLILLGVLVSGCTAEPQTQPVQEKSKYPVLVCPNPDCTLHDSRDGVSLSGMGNKRLRPIDMEYSPNKGANVYLCQICGTEWTG